MEDVKPNDLKNTCYKLLAGYKANSEAFYQFVSSSKEAVAVLNEVCESIVSFECIESNKRADRFVAVFCKAGANCEHEDQKCELTCTGRLASVHDFFLQRMIKYANKVFLSTYMKKGDYMRIITCLAEDKRQSYEKLAGGANPQNGVIKSITTGVSIYEQMSRVVENYKINTMTVYVGDEYPLEILFNLENLYPVEVDIIAVDQCLLPQVCEANMLGVISDNYFGLKRVTLHLDSMYQIYDDESEMLVETLGIFEQKFEELTSINVVYKRMLIELPAYVEEIKEVITAFEEKMAEERKVPMLIEWTFKYPEFNRKFIAKMKKAFPDYQYDPEEGFNCFEKALSPNVTFDVEIIGHSGGPVGGMGDHNAVNPDCAIS